MEIEPGQLAQENGLMVRGPKREKPVGDFIAELKNSAAEQNVDFGL
jgi:hypothetical protein